jgi:hypothetical protein
MNNEEIVNILLRFCICTDLYRDNIIEDSPEDIKEKESIRLEAKLNEYKLLLSYLLDNASLRPYGNKKKFDPKNIKPYLKDLDIIFRRSISSKKISKDHAVIWHRDLRILINVLNVNLF